MRIEETLKTYHQQDGVNPSLFRVRFEDVTSNSTKILFLTDGMLLREAMVDPSLYRYTFTTGWAIFLSPVTHLPRNGR